MSSRVCVWGDRATEPDHQRQAPGKHNEKSHINWSLKPKQHNEPVFRHPCTSRVCYLMLKF